MDESRVSKKNCEDCRESESDRPCDRLSEFPDSLLLLVLSLLEMKDVVRTTVLSKRWKDVWTTVPCLDFCGRNNGSFIDGALAKWKGDKILKFSLRFWPPSDFRDSWLLLPIQKRVENLIIHLQPEYCPPQPLYSCSSIAILSLSYCYLKIEENVNVQWNQLKSLEIEYPSYLSEDAMNRIISGAPLLEELKLLSWNISENLNIRSTSLKMLKINMYIDTDFGGNSPVLEIWAPNLQSLEVSGLSHARCLFNVPSLTVASLGLDYQHYYYTMLNEPSRYTVLEEMLRPAFLGLSHVQKLTLNEWAIKFLVHEMKKENFVLFPKLEMLIFEQRESNYIWGNEYNSLAPNTNTVFPSLRVSLLQLKTIVITCDVRDASIFAIVEFLLENARELEKMVIRLRKHEAYPEEYTLAIEKVVSMLRASRYVKVIIRKI